MSAPPAGPGIYGVVAEFDTVESAVAAARAVHAEGYRKIDAYSPYPIEDLAEATGHHHSWLPLMVLVAGVIGGVAGYLLQYVTAVWVYPMNIGGRPLHSWPAFIPPAYETTILFAAGTAVFGMIGLNGLPQPYHPLFNIPAFQRASIDRFFVAIEATDKRYDRQGTLAFMNRLGAVSVAEVPL